MYTPDDIARMSHEVIAEHLNSLSEQVTDLKADLLEYRAMVVVLKNCLIITPTMEPIIRRANEILLKKLS